MTCGTPRIVTGVASSVEPAVLEAVTRIPTGAVAVSRGGLWPGEQLSGILHHSPPFKLGARPRVVLVLDPVTNMEEWE